MEKITLTDKIIQILKIIHWDQMEVKKDIAQFKQIKELIMKQMDMEETLETLLMIQVVMEETRVLRAMQPNN